MTDLRKGALRALKEAWHKNSAYITYKWEKTVEDMVTRLEAEIYAKVGPRDETGYKRKM